MSDSYRTVQYTNDFEVDKLRFGHLDKKRDGTVIIKLSYGDRPEGEQYDTPVHIAPNVPVCSNAGAFIRGDQIHFQMDLDANTANLLEEIMKKIHTHITNEIETDKELFFVPYIVNDNKYRALMRCKHDNYSQILTRAYGPDGERISVFGINPMEFMNIKFDIPSVVVRGHIVNVPIKLFSMSVAS